MTEPQNPFVVNLLEHIVDCNIYMFLVVWQDECKRVSTESQNLRLELSNKFQEAIKVQIYL